MPSRSCTLAILAFWLATMGWFGYAEIWPRLWPGKTAPFTIDLAQEVSNEPRSWTLYHNGINVGTAKTQIRPSGAAYEITTRFWFNTGEERDKGRLSYEFLGGLFRVDARGMRSAYRVTRNGDLLGLDADVTAFFRAPQGHSDIDIRVEGRVENGTFTPHWRLVAPLKYEQTTEPVQVPTNHSVLNPLQPWNRLENVRAGQRWRVQLFDPLTESVSATLGALAPQVSVPRVEYLDAGVKELTEDLVWKGQPVSCLIIEYRGEGDDDLLARTWVRQDDGLVLRQEVTRGEKSDHEERLALQRDDK